MTVCGCLVGAEKAQKLGYLNSVVEPVGPGLKSAKEASLELLKNVAIQNALKLADETRKNPLLLHYPKLKYYLGLWIAKKFAQLSVNSQYEAPFKILEVITFLIPIKLD